MTNTTLISPPRPLSSRNPRDDARGDARVAASSDRTLRGFLVEVLPLVDFIPVAGPPAVLVVGPLVLFGLMLAGAFACLCTLMVLLAAMAAVAWLLGAMLASPYLLVRRFRGRRTRRPSSDAHARQAIRIDWPRVVA